MRGAHVNTSSIKTAQLHGGNELVMFQGSASNICSWNYSIKLRTNDKFDLASKGRIVSWLYFDLGHHLAVMKTLHHTIWLYYSTHDSDERYGVTYLECLIRLALTEWDFPLWSPAALSVLSPHSYLCQPAEKRSISLSLSSLYSVAQWFASYWGLATLCEEQTPHSITSHRQQTKANSTNTHTHSQ